MAVGFNLEQQSFGLHRRHHRPAGLKAIETRKAAGGCVHAAVLGHHRDLGQAVALADGEIVGVVGGRHLDATGAKGRIDMLIGDDRDAAAHQGQLNAAAHQVGVAGIGGIHRHGGVAEHRFRAGGGDHQVVDGVIGPWGGSGGPKRNRPGQGCERITQMPQRPLHLLHFHLQITHCRTGSGTPIDEIFAAINQALLMQPHKGFHHCFVEPRIEGEALAAPIHRIAQAAQLADDGAAAFRLPGPGPLKESIATQVIFVGSFSLELLFQDRLHGNRGVVGARQAEHILALQALEAHHRVDQGGVEGMAHVQAAGHVRRRNHDAERFAGGVGIGMEGPRLLPGGLPAGLGAGRVVGLGQGVGHGGGLGAGGLRHGGGSGVAPSSQRGEGGLEVALT